MHIVHSWKILQYSRQFLVPTLLRVLHFPHVKLANARDGVPSVDDRRRLPLRFGEDDIDEIFRGWDRRDLFEVVLHDDDALRGNSLSDDASRFFSIKLVRF